MLARQNSKTLKVSCRFCASGHPRSSSSRSQTASTQGQEQVISDKSLFFQSFVSNGATAASYLRASFVPISSQGGHTREQVSKRFDEKTEFVAHIKESLGKSDKGGSSHEKMEVDQDRKQKTLKTIGDYVASMVVESQEFILHKLGQVVPTKAAVANPSVTSAAEVVKKKEDPRPTFVRRQSKFVRKADIDRTTRFCVSSVRAAASSSSSYTSVKDGFDASENIRLGLDELNNHLSQFPFAKGYATKLGVVPDIVRLRSYNATGAPSTNAKAAVDPVSLEVRLAAKEALARLGHVNPLPSRGIRILCIDGGGMKGVIALEVLRRLERQTGHLIHELFDIMVGVSTGSIITSLLGIKKLTVDEVDDIYTRLGTEVFTQSMYGGVKGMVTSQAYYDTTKFENIVKSFTGELPMATTSRHDSPKIAIVGTLVSDSAGAIPYVFRNYNFAANVTSSYRGSVRYKVWQAIRASAAAPGYFDDFHVNRKIFQDGGVSCNNPSHIAIHEAQRLWPGEQLQCVMSIGLGRFDPLSQSLDDDGERDPKGLSIADKFNKLVWSATDTETVHSTLQDLLEPSVYFRFNPYLSECYSLDEIRPEKRLGMVSDAKRYCRQNESRLVKASQQLTAKPNCLQSIQRTFKQYQQLKKQS